MWSYAIDSFTFPSTPPLSSERLRLWAGSWLCALISNALHDTQWLCHSGCQGNWYTVEVALSKLRPFLSSPDGSDSADWPDARGTYEAVVTGSQESERVEISHMRSWPLECACNAVASYSFLHPVPQYCVWSVRYSFTRSWVFCALNRMTNICWFVYRATALCIMYDCYECSPNELRLQYWPYLFAYIHVH